MTVDEILNDPLAALDLPDGSIPVSVIVLCEYAEPGSDIRPGARRLALTSDDDLPPMDIDRDAPLRHPARTQRRRRPPRRRRGRLMASRVCNFIDPHTKRSCPNLISKDARGGKCPEHQAVIRAERWQTHDRHVYTAEHRAERRRWQRRIDRGEPVHCWRCKTPIRPGDTWHFGHRDGLPSLPECPPCNTRDGAQRRHRT